MKLLKIILFIIISTLQFSFENVPKGQLQINFQHLVGNQALVLGNKYYTNIHGEKFTVSKFNYYISNIWLKRNGRWWKQPNSYYLIQSNNPNSQTITIPNVPLGQYEAISFLVGVDKKRNTAGAQEGALDPAQGMFWSWNTGYVFLKLEGKTLVKKAGKALTKKYRFHCGGFARHNNIKKKTLNLRAKPLRIVSNRSTKLKMKVDLQRFFSGKETLKIHQNLSLMSPARSAKVSDNYSQTFNWLR